jgi:hypothetical protein
MLTSVPCPVSTDSARDDEFLPTAEEWAEFFRYVDGLGHYADELPELDDEFCPDPEDELWWDALTAGGFNPEHGSPWDIELLTLSRSEYYHDDTQDTIHSDDRQDAFIGGAA